VEANGRAVIQPAFSCTDWGKPRKQSG